MLAWWYGLVVSELPLQTIASQAGVLATASRWLPRGVRRFAWLVSGLSWLGLLGLYRIARGANAPLTAALDVGLGTDRRTARRRKRRPAVADDADLPRLRTRHRYQLRRVRKEEPAGHLAPPRPRPQWPGAGAAAGSGWRVDDGKQTRASTSVDEPPRASSAGCAYRSTIAVSPRSTWPDHIIDVKQAIAWVKAHIAEYGGDPDFIAITGGSAGGHLSSLAALTANDPNFQPGFEEADTRVQAAVPFYGVYDFSRTDGALHPMMVPFLEKDVLKRAWADFPDSFRGRVADLLRQRRRASVLRPARP